MVRSFAAALALAVFLPAAATASPQERAPAPQPVAAQPSSPQAPSPQNGPGAPPQASPKTPPAGATQAPADTGPFALTGQEVNAERDDPEACFTFNRPLAKARPGLQDPYAGKVEVLARNTTPAGAATPAATAEAGTPVQKPVVARDRTLCVQKLEHGHRYTVTLKAGLPAAGGLRPWPRRSRARLRC
ncbi:hypothetical protein [Nitrospirillum sp. BR 11828]|uniref:hypothetical protein n=1 Tax=Nitrospirillum sp. BR 11828 TaxID=3104325 RepID=UPI002ACABF97|nr:hypothetical protein [Nitrospirillum sp. BR 11828]MDZ5646348.1 hypothetical protein [Nitrospirillum sp. BR 11828]